MAIGFPPSYELIVRSEISKEEFSQKSLMAFEKLKWKLVIGTPGFLKVNTKNVFSTSGETFSVNYKNMKCIKMKSKSRFLNIVDWGMNKSNVCVFWSYFSSNV